MLEWSSWVSAMLDKGSLMLTQFLPVNMLNTRIDLSLSTTAINLPLGLILRLIGMELAERSFRNYV